MSDHTDQLLLCAHDIIERANKEFLLLNDPDIIYGGYTFLHPFEPITEESVATLNNFLADMAPSTYTIVARLATPYDGSVPKSLKVKVTFKE